MKRIAFFSLIAFFIAISYFSLPLYADALEEGTYVVNPNGTGDFTSLEEVIEILAEEGVEGPVVIKLAAGTYNGPFTINKIRGSSTTNTVTIRSLADAPTAVLTRPTINSNDRQILLLIATKNLILENLTFKISVNSNGWGINMRSKVENIVIRSCSFKSEAEDAKLNEHIVVVNSASDTYATGNPGSYITIEGNSFTNGNMAICINGQSTTYLPGINIRNNKFSNISRYAMRFQFLEAYKISGNVIEMNPDGDSESCGINVRTSKGKFQMIGNRIFNAKRFGIEFGYYSTSFPLEQCHISTGETAIVANNMIGGGFTYAYDYGTHTSGIVANAAIDNVAFYYNSINMDLPSGNFTRAAAITIDNEWSAKTSTNVTLINNSLAYTGGGVNGRALYVHKKSSIVEIDYNNYYTNTARFAFYESEVGNLATLRVVSGKNQNSIVGDPKYLSQFDLHSYAAQLSGVGTPIASITVDIDGDERHATKPCIGADEYTPMFDHDLAVTGLSGATITKVGTPEKYEVIVKNEGRIWQTGYIVYLMDQKTNKTLASLDVDEVIWSEQENTHQLTWIPENKGIHELYALVSLTGDENHNNDRFPVSPATVKVMVQELTELPTPAVRINANFANQSAVLSWEPIVGAKSYKIYASAEAHATNWPLYTTTTNTFLNIDLGMENLFFKVIASNTTTMLEASDDEDDYLKVNVTEPVKK